MNHYNTLLKLKVVARAAPTWLVGAAVVAPFVVDEAVKVLGADSPVVAVAARVAAWLAAAVAIIRKVTPVLPGAEGILPSGGPHTSTERYLANELAYTRGVLKEGG